MQAVPGMTEEPSVFASLILSFSFLSSLLCVSTLPHSTPLGSVYGIHRALTRPSEDIKG